MSILDLNLQKDATSGTTVGGTATALSSDGVDVKNGVHIADMTETDFTVRTNIMFRNRNPSRLSDGSYTKGKRFITVVVPKDLGDDAGGVVFNLIRIEVEAHPKTTVAELTSLHMLGAQMFTDSDVTDFLVNGSLK
jgi:hypothetical protein